MYSNLDRVLKSILGIRKNQNYSRKISVRVYRQTNGVTSDRCIQQSWKIDPKITKVLYERYSKR